MPPVPSPSATPSRPWKITASDIENLAVELAGLQAGIDQAEQDIAALNEATESASVTLRRRVRANEEAIAEIETTIGKLRNRIRANEEAIAEINATIGRFRNRINRLEDGAEDHEARIAALEAEQAPAPASELSPFPRVSDPARRVRAQPIARAGRPGDGWAASVGGTMTSHGSRDGSRAARSGPDRGERPRSW